MIEPNSRPAADLLEQAIAALRSTRVPDGPPDNVVTATMRAFQEACIAPAPNRQSRRSKTMFRIATACSVAVAAALLLTLGFRLGSPRKHEPIEPVAKTPPAAVEIDGKAFQIQGPFTHQDLTVFLLCSDRQDAQDFLTLDEGLKNGLVSITEQEHEQVRA
jgi:hypothetical protein